MKIAIFTDTFLPEINGVTNTLGKLASYMEEKGIEYRIFAPVNDNIAQNHRIIRFLSINFFLYPERRFSFPNIFLVERELKEFKPDLIHIVTEFNIGLVGLRYAEKNNIPHVSSYHTNISQYLKYFKLKILENVSWSYLLWFHNKSKRMYCPSNVTKKLLDEKGFERVEIWGRGIETEQFSPSLRDEEYRKAMKINDKVVFLYVGRVSPEKDVDIFMNVKNRLNKEFRDEIHFIMVGDGPLLEEIKEKDNDNITYTGSQRGEGLSKLYASSDIFFFPSSTETYGNVILEAMASGLAVIASNSGGITENLINGYNGLSCTGGIEEEFYNAAVRLLKDVNERKKLAENARDYTSRRPWSYVFDKLFESYKEVIGLKSQRDVNIRETA